MGTRELLIPRQEDTELRAGETIKGERRRGGRTSLSLDDAGRDSSGNELSENPRTEPSMTFQWEIPICCQEGHETCPHISQPEPLKDENLL